MNVDDDPVRRYWTRMDERFRGLREETEPWEALTAEPAGVTHREVSVAGAAALWVEPATSDAVMLYIHGGGFISGSVWTHRKLAGHLAAASGTKALLVSYPYAPGQVHPAQLDQVTGAYTWLLDQGSGPLVLAGDSCGGWLALSLAVRARDRGLPLPAAMLLISPGWTWPSAARATGPTPTRSSTRTSWTASPPASSARRAPPTPASTCCRPT
ncbi:hypothetical protein GCM10027610_048520 [Dactylosporangium cerinum]